MFDGRDVSLLLLRVRNERNLRLWKSEEGRDVRELKPKSRDWRFVREEK